MSWKRVLNEQRPGMKNRATLRRGRDGGEGRRCYKGILSTVFKGLETIGPHLDLRTISLSRV